MKRSGFWVIIGLVTLSGLIFALFSNKPHVFRGSVIEPPVPAPDFKLTDNHGNDFILSDHKGKFMLMFFGYTYCPDVCPAALFEMKSIKKGLKENSNNVEFVFITVDPERDSFEQLGRYLNSYDAEFWGLTSDLNTLSQVWKDYGVYRQVQESGNATGYLVDHSARLYLINPQGDLEITYLSDIPVDDIVGDLTYLIKQEKSK